MKKIIFMLMSALLIVSTGNAQQQSDTTSTDRRTKQQAESGQPTDMAREPKGEQPTGQPQRSSSFSGEMEVVTADEIPQTLRSTLEADEKYKGWENAIIYHNKRTDEYLLSPRPYRFDGDGNPIEASQAGQQENQQRDNDRGSQQGEDQSSAYRQSPTDPNRSLDTSENQTESDQNQPTQTEDYANQAQQQNTDDTQQQNSELSQQDSSNQSQQQSNAYRGDDRNIDEISMTGMTRVEQNEYPQALRETLKDSKYSGWENGQLYHNESSGEYLLVIDDQTNRNNGKKQQFRFDRNGEAIDNVQRNDN